MMYSVRPERSLVWRTYAPLGLWMGMGCCSLDMVWRSFCLLEIDDTALLNSDHYSHTPRNYLLKLKTKYCMHLFSTIWNLCLNVGQHCLRSWSLSNFAQKPKVRRPSWTSGLEKCITSRTVSYPSLALASMLGDPVPHREADTSDSRATTYEALWARPDTTSNHGPHLRMDTTACAQKRHVVYLLIIIFPPYWTV